VGSRGVQGFVGSIGTQGFVGSQGAVGTSLRIIDELASSSLLPPGGQIGDAYLINGSLWVWNGTNWVDVGPIQGAVGYSGSIGVAGFVGSQGDLGYVGSTGAGFVGSQGLQGVVGFTGSGGGGGGGSLSSITDLITTVTNVVSLRFDSTTGLIVTDVGSGVAQVSINSSLLNPDSFKSIAVTGQNTITALGADTIRFVAGPNMTITTDDLASPKTITFTSTGGGGGASDTQPIKTFNILNNFSAPLLGSAVFAPNANDTIRSVRLTNGKIAGVDLTVGLYRNGTLLNFFTLPAGYFTYAYEDLAYPININDYLTVNVVSGSGVNFSLALFNI
jgi:hypothetical protein